MTDRIPYMNRYLDSTVVAIMHCVCGVILDTSSDLIIVPVSQ